ncbi:amidase family protein, partial [Georgenia sp. 10Sc9-8]|nr:amidase family protein [Georgenia halotolerans]
MNGSTRARLAVGGLVPAITLTLLAQPATAEITAAEDADQVTEATIGSIHDALSAGDLTCTDLVQSYIDRIEAYDADTTNAIQTINDEALETAAELDAAYADSGLTGALHCIPVLVKDQVETADMPTTYGSAIFEG